MVSAPPLPPLAACLPLSASRNAASRATSAASSRYANNRRTRSRVLRIRDLAQGEVADLFLAARKLHPDAQAHALRLRPDEARQLDCRTKLRRIGAGKIDPRQRKHRAHRHVAAAAGRAATMKLAVASARRLIDRAMESYLTDIN